MSPWRAGRPTRSAAPRRAWRLPASRHCRSCGTSGDLDRHRVRSWPRWNAHSGPSTSWSTTPAGHRRRLSPARTPTHGATSFEAMVLSVIMLTDRVLPGMRERRLGSDPDVDLVGRARSDTEPRPVEHLAGEPARVVQDARRRGGTRRRDIERHRAGAHRDRPDPIPRRTQGGAGRTAPPTRSSESAADDGDRTVWPSRGVRRRGGVPVQRKGLVRHRFRRPRRRRADSQRRLIRPSAPNAG